MHSLPHPPYYSFETGEVSPHPPLLFPITDKSRKLQKYKGKIKKRAIWSPIT